MPYEERQLLPAFLNVGASEKALIPSLPKGKVFRRVMLELGGTTLAKSDFDRILLKAGGKPILDITGSHLDAINQYLGESANANYLTIDFSDRDSRNIGPDDVDVPAFDSNVVAAEKTISLQVDIGAGAVAPTLEAYAVLADAQAGAVKDLFRGFQTAEFSFAGSGKYALALPTGSVQGNIIRRVYLFHSNITTLDVKLDGDILVDGASTGLLEFEQNELTRVTQAGLLVWDPLVENDQRKAISTVRQDGSPANLDFRVTLSAADTITCYVELLSTLPRM